MTEIEMKDGRYTVEEGRFVYEAPGAELTEFIQTSRLHVDPGMSAPTHCGHPRECIVSGDGGTAHCAWCEEVARLQEELERATTYKIALDTVPVMIHGTPCDTCGGTDWQCAECLEKIADYDGVTILKRPREELERLRARLISWRRASTDNGIRFNRMEAALASTQERLSKAYAEGKRLREELEYLRSDDGHPHESGDECISCERLATERAWPYCNQCLLEHQLQDCNEVASRAMSEEIRLHMLLEQDGAAHLPCQHCGKNVATPTLESVELCFECWERLRELIPDMWMLDWLVKAAHRWWKDNGGEGTQKDIAAGYALVKKLCREANIDEI